MKAFVTGSTGLLGNNLVRLLIEQGHEVKALVRSTAGAAKLFGALAVEYVGGDMENVEAFAGEFDETLRDEVKCYRQNGYAK